MKKQKLLRNGEQTAGNIFAICEEEMRDIKEALESEVENYRDKFSSSEEGLIKHWPKKYNIYGWLVRMQTGGQLTPHMHEKGWISGSVYIKVPKKITDDSGNLVVCMEEEKTDGQVSEFKKNISVASGTLCLFPSSLLHYTVPYYSKEQRIVLAFDLVPE
jgi:hypothetical protein